MTSIPDLTRLLARIHEWQDGHGKPGGRAEAARRLEEANKLLDEVSQHAGRRAAGVAGQQPIASKVTGTTIIGTSSGIGGRMPLDE